MAGWSDAILLNQGQSATVRALVSSYVGMTVTIAVDQPPIQIVSQWDGFGFKTDIMGKDYVAGYGVSVGNGEISYLLNYVSDVSGLSTVDITAQVRDASIVLTEA